MLDKILFVCTANVCRSPMACAIYNALAQDRDLPVMADSAGVAALAGKPMTDDAIKVLEEAGILPGDHRAKQLDRKMLSDADLILTMSPAHVAEIRRIQASTNPNIHTLPGYASGAYDVEISDPYGQGMTAYRACLRHLHEHIERLVRKMDESI